jgi:hypothetical protein
VNDRNRQLAEAREDERVRHVAAKRNAVREAAILERERIRMTERNDLADDRTDDTGFFPGGLI